MRILKNLLDLNKRAWDNIAEKYDDRSETPISNVFATFTAKLPEKGKVLDLGCGTGLPYARYLVERGFDVLGVDLSEEMVKVAFKNVPEASFVQLSMNEITYRDEFDGVMSSFSMLLLPPDLFKETASRIYSALVAGGYFYLSLNEPASLSDDPDSEVFVNIMGQDMYSRAYTVEEIESIFQPLGFSLMNFNRLIHVSEEFGEEHVIEFIYQKT
ncbi:MAG: methyltransferase domain-containing protein [Candidatus Bathyarchaeota archaeon]|nr:methyltransferase domain-containing protein [Candidatus Bathyarchaeota archaeon]